MQAFRAPSRRAALTIGALLFAGAGSLSVALRTSIASDHQDTPEVELHARLDINDVYAFPGSNADRIALVLTTSSPITPAAAAGAAFDPDILYQIKVDNTGDGVEDVVLQLTFDGEGSAQVVTLRGPAAPSQTGRVNTMIAAPPTIAGPVSTVLGSAPGIQLFAGLRDDPFYIDLEQFFKIIPDRAPVQGPLSKIGPKPVASSFRNRSGPAAPSQTGRVNTMLAAPPTIAGPVSTVLGSAPGIQLFAGLRDAPFYIDLEQFFKIIPDRAPVQGPLSKIGPKPVASSFRNAGIEFRRDINTLGIVI